MRLIQVIIFLMIFGSAVTIFQAIGNFITSAFSFGKDIYGFIDSLVDDKIDKDDNRYEKLLKAISDKIDSSEKSVINSVIEELDLRLQFDDLFEQNKFMSTLLIDIRNIIESRTDTVREENIRRFKNNFREHEAEIQNIARLLSDTASVGGLYKPLLNLFVDKVDCNLTSLQEFMDYYMNAVSNAIAIDLMNERFTVVDLSNQTMANWQKQLEKLFEKFKSQRKNCIARFPQLVKDDLEGDETATDLQRKNALRYSDKRNSVVYVGSDTDCEIKYLQSDGFIFFKTSARKIVFFEKKDENTETLDHNATQVGDSCKKAFPAGIVTSRLVNNIGGNCDKETIFKTIDDMYFWRGYTLRFILIMDDKPQNQIVIAQGSRTTRIKACGKVIVTGAEEWKTEDASHSVYKTLLMNKVTSGVTIVTVNTTLLFCLVINCLVVLI
ncbi:uncharacterized protein LOC128552520 [Mercenaria mercenaria]|uniref:uncharacterized protein LOC128552520 n=1 Tax=Mercenaria mercenaria TaxID=6596 RepID=UPI00234FA35D|nr:uncharacterized protein LOC128552520 [Mercenaria mercenaria]